jgi:phosphoribosyl-ATP pyrophosphohydrolase
VYWSRRRGLWVKGLTSGATQKLLRVDLDCDRDTLRFIVQQSGAGFCHQATANCWSNSFGSQLLEEQVDASACTKNPSSYTQRLLNDDGLLNAKLLEEASELVAADPMDRDAVLHEAADSFFFTYMKMRRSGWRFADLEGLLARRAGRVTRRQGDAKLQNLSSVEVIQ